MSTKKESKHEPGPWILGGASGRMITTPSGYAGDGFIADVDTLANAKLITAAPDMLDALLLIKNENPDLSGEAFSKLYEAIKKATE